MGSAWMPWVRPTQGVLRNSRARARNTWQSRLTPPSSNFPTSRICSAMPVSITSLDVMPKSDRLSDSGQERDHVVAHLALDLIDPRDVEGCPARDFLEGIPRNQAALRLNLADCDFNLQPTAILALVGPDFLDFRTGITLDHDLADSQINVEEHCVIHHGNCEQKRIDPVQHAAGAREKTSRVFDLGVALDE